MARKDRKRNPVHAVKAKMFGKASGQGNCAKVNVKSMIPSLDSLGSVKFPAQASMEQGH